MSCRVLILTKQLNEYLFRTSNVSEWWEGEKDIYGNIYVKTATKTIRFREHVCIHVGWMLALQTKQSTEVQCAVHLLPAWRAHFLGSIEERSEISCPTIWKPLLHILKAINIHSFKDQRFREVFLHFMPISVSLFHFSSAFFGRKETNDWMKEEKYERLMPPRRTRTPLTHLSCPACYASSLGPLTQRSTFSKLRSVILFIQI